MTTPAETITSPEQLVAKYPQWVSYSAVTDTLTVSAAGTTAARSTFPTQPYAFDILAIGNTMAWTGGAVFSATNARSRYWVLREAFRMANNEYIPLPSNVYMIASGNNNLALPRWHFPHVVPEDPGTIEFTFSAEDGQRDKKTRMSSGRYFARFCPWMLDSTVQFCEREIRADASDDFELITGADQIEYYYNHGPASCMSHKRIQWGRDLLHHPTAVYDAPGWALAIIRKDEKGCSARSLVWVNPANEKQKYFVRVYGDPVLQKRLQRKGYTNVMPERMPLSYKQAWANRPDCMTPYLDMGGWLFFDHEYMWLLNATGYNKAVRDPTIKPYIGQRTGITFVPTKFMGYRCNHCGVEKHENRDGWMAGSNRVVCDTCVREQGYVLALNASGAKAVALPELTVLVGTNRYLADVPTFKRYNINRLDPLYYFDTPTNSSFVREGEGTTLINGRLWLNSDIIEIITKSGLVERRNARDNQLDLSGYIPLLKRDAYKTYAAPELKDKVRPSTGRGYIYPPMYVRYHPVAGSDKYGRYANGNGISNYFGRVVLYPAGSGTPASIIRVYDIPANHIRDFARTKLWLWAKDFDAAINGAFAGVYWAAAGPTFQIMTGYRSGRNDFLGSMKLLLDPKFDETFFARFGATTEEQREVIRRLRSTWLAIRKEYEAAKAEQKKETA